MTRWPHIFIPLFLITGCAAGKTDHKMNHYESSAASCYENDKVLDCDWENATDDWLRVTKNTFEDKL